LRTVITAETGRYERTTIMIAEKAADVIANGVAASPADGALAA
jgi:hypothetical protein